MMKHEWRKHETDLYMPKAKPTVVTIPKQPFITIKGKGNPNQADFSDRIRVLYSIAYAIKMMPKKGYTPVGYMEYTVYPLEGVWDLTEEGRQSQVLNKDELLYTIMIRQPEFVTTEVFEKALNEVKKKKPHPLLDEVVFEEIEDGLSVQMLHVGPYDDELITFEKMKTFINEQNLTIVSLKHREIYLSDFRKVTPDKLKTVLRYRVE